MDAMRPVLLAVVIVAGVLIFDDKVFHGYYTRGATMMVTQIAQSMGIGR